MIKNEGYENRYNMWKEEVQKFCDLADISMDCFFCLQNDKEEIEMDYSEDNREYTCSKCGRTYSLHLALQLHLKLTSEREFIKRNPSVLKWAGK